MDEKKDDVLDTATSELIGAVSSGPDPKSGLEAKPEEKSGESKTDDKEKPEAQTEQKQSAAEDKKEPEPPKISLRGSEYTVEEFLKLFPADVLEEALDARDNQHVMNQKFTNAHKKASEVQNASMVPLQLIKKLVTMKNADALMDIIRDEIGEEAAKEFESMRDFNPELIQHPAEMELAKMLEQQRRDRGTAIIKASEEKLVKDWKLTPAELKTVKEKAYDMYLATCPLDENGEPILEKGNYERATLDMAFMSLPIYRQKVEAGIKADLDEKAAKEQKEREEAEKLKDGQPPKKTAGVSGTAKTPKTVEEIEIPDEVAREILLHTQGTT